MIFAAQISSHFLFFHVHIIYVITGGNNPAPRLEYLRISDFRRYRDTVRFRKIELIKAALFRALTYFHYFLNNHNPVLVFQCIAVFPLALRKDRMHDQCIFRVIYPEIAALVVAVTHSPDSLLCVMFCLVFGLLPRLIKVILVLQYCHGTLYLGSDFRLIPLIHGCLIGMVRRFGQHPDGQ